jgi:hypothetical protein
MPEADCEMNNTAPNALLEVSGSDFGGCILFFSRFLQLFPAVADIPEGSIEVNNLCIFYSVKQPNKQQLTLETEVHIVLVFCCGHPVIRHLCSCFVFIISDFRPAAQLCSVRKLDPRRVQ